MKRKYEVGLSIKKFDSVYEVNFFLQRGRFLRNRVEIHYKDYDVREFLERSDFLKLITLEEEEIELLINRKLDEEIDNFISRRAIDSSVHVCNNMAFSREADTHLEDFFKKKKGTCL